MWVPINSGNRSGSCSENCGVRIGQVVGCHSENGISYSENGIPNSESCSENTPELDPRAPRMALSLRERFSRNWGGPQASEKCRWGSQMEASGHTLQLVHNRLQLCTFVAFRPFCKGNFRHKKMTKKMTVEEKHPKPPFLRTPNSDFPEACDLEHRYRHQNNYRARKGVRGCDQFCNFVWCWGVFVAEICSGWNKV